MFSKKVEFSNQDGNLLTAFLELPADGRPFLYSVFVHCFTCSKNILAAKYITKALARNGVGVLRFDFTGLGESEGNFSDTNFSSNITDIVSAANFLKEKFEAPTLLIGHSLGGTAAIHAAHRIPSIKLVSTIGSPACPYHVSHLFENNLEKIESEGQAKVTLGERSFVIKRQFVEDLQSQDDYKAIRTLNRPIMIFHSPVDKIVGIDNASNIYKYARHPKNFISLDDANHLVTNKKNALFIGNMIGSWAKNFFPKEEKVFSTDAPVAVETKQGGFTSTIYIGEHRLVADEPLEVGGANLGPTPYEYLLAALGACTSMTLQMYARRKKWNLKEVGVHLYHEKRHIDDAKECENPDAKADIFIRKIELLGNLDEEQKKRLFEIAEKCPVHRTLHNTIRVETKQY